MVVNVSHGQLVGNWEMLPAQQISPEELQCPLQINIESFWPPLKVEVSQEPALACAQAIMSGCS